MSVLALVLILVIVGVALYLLSLVPMHPAIYKVIVAVVLLAVILWVLSNFVDLGGIYIAPRHRHG